MEKTPTTCRYLRADQGMFYRSLGLYNGDISLYKSSPICEGSTRFSLGQMVCVQGGKEGSGEDVTELSLLSLNFTGLKFPVDLVPGEDFRFLGSDLTFPPIVLDLLIFIVLLQTVSLVKALHHGTV